MKTKLTAFLLSTFYFPLCLPAQGTAFTYQGRLNDGANPAQGIYDLRFAIYDAVSGPAQVGSPLTNAAVPISNGLFTVTLDFGPGVFTGPARWLEIGVRTNGSAGDFMMLTPRQPLSATPYSLFAPNAGSAGSVAATNLTGTIGNSQLASNSVTVAAGTGLSGGGSVILGGSTTLNNAGVLSVTGNSDITATPAAGNVTLGTTATSANTASTIVKRGASGNFSAGTITASLSGNATTATTAANFSGSLAGQVTGTQTATVVSFVGGQSAANVASGVIAANAATSANVINTIVKRDSSGDFSAGSLTLAGSLNLPLATTNSGIIYSGGDPLLHVFGSGNSFFGMNAGNLTMTGYENTGSGFAALGGNSGGLRNTADGCAALRYNTSGSWNTASGNAALLFNTSGNYNTAGGAYALMSNTNGNYNTAVGGRALFAGSNGSFNTAVGFDVFESLTNGADNAALGASALRYVASGDANTAVGCETLYQIGSGSNNIALGHKAGFNLAAGSYNILIGSLGVNGDNNTLRIGTQGIHTNTYIAGIHGATSASGAAVYVNAAGQLGTLTSSSRFKQDIKPMDDASEALYALRPVTFHYTSGVDPEGVPQFGLVAEEVQQTSPELVIRDASGRPYTVRYEQVNAMLLNEFLKQHRKVRDLESRLDHLEQLLSARNGGDK